jgi:hypothetical protein
MEDSDLRELSNEPDGEDSWYYRILKFLSKRTMLHGNHRLVGARRSGFLDELAMSSLGGFDLRGPFGQPGNASDEDVPE